MEPHTPRRCTLRLPSARLPVLRCRGRPAHAALLLLRCCYFCAGRRLVQEQEFVNSMRLSDEYLKKQRKMASF